MPHGVDGFELAFTHPYSWKARRSQKGKELDIIPVAWSGGRRQEPGSADIFQRVHFKDRQELDRVAASRDPFVIALARAKDPSQKRLEFGEFVGIFEVLATGVIVDENSLETKVIRRLQAE